LVSAGGLCPKNSSAINRIHQNTHGTRTRAATTPGNGTMGRNTWTTIKRKEKKKEAGEPHFSFISY
jgi:hypothetical protein